MPGNIKSHPIGVAIALRGYLSAKLRGEPITRGGVVVGYRKPATHMPPGLAKLSPALVAYCNALHPREAGYRLAMEPHAIARLLAAWSAEGEAAAGRAPALTRPNLGPPVGLLAPEDAGGEGSPAAPE